MKYRVLKSFGGTYELKGKTIRISAGRHDIIELPVSGHDFEKAGLIERVPPETEITRKLSYNPV